MCSANQRCVFCWRGGEVWVRPAGSYCGYAQIAGRPHPEFAQAPV